MKFSIILPVYNKANTIIQALDSIYSQTIQDFEVIVVNDGSTDNTLDVLAHYNKPIRVLTQKNGGVSVARNTGIENAKGEFICFLDADDMWFPNHLEVIVDMMTIYPNVDYFGTCHKCSFPDGRIVDCNKGITSLNDVVLVNDLIGFINKYGGILNTNGICVRRSMILKENIRFVVGEIMGEDVDVWYRIALKHPISISKQLTTIYRREYSTATKVTTNTPNWCFVERKSAILSDKEISSEIKTSFLIMCDRYHMAISREMSYKHNKTEARKRIMLVENKFCARFFFSFLIVYLPSFILDVLPSNYKK